MRKSLFRVSHRTPFSKLSKHSPTNPKPQRSERDVKPLSDRERIQPSKKSRR
jgi:hypothetical protein